MKKSLMVAMAVMLLVAVQSQAALLAPGSLVSSDFVLGPTTPGKWGNPTMGTSGGVVTWSIMGPGLSFAAETGSPGLSVDLATIFPVGFHAEIEAAFAAWSAVADITFIEVPDSGHAFDAPGASGDIRIGAHAFDGAGSVLAHGYYPPNNGTSAAGDIHFDIAETWKIGFGGDGFDIFQVLAHEIGHAIGLNHTAVPNSLMNAFYTEAFAGPQADDIAGAQFIYGPAQLDGVIPEPATLSLAGFALLSLAARRRRAA